jgi:hypothetical protein
MGSPTPPLRKLQRNDIIKAIEAIGLDPVQFSLEKHSGGVKGPTTWITPRSPESRFVVGGQSRSYSGNYVAGDGPTSPYFGSTWPAVMRNFRAWLEEVKLDLETPDLWAELQSAAKLLEFDSGDAAENTPFTHEEQEGIARRLQELAENAKRTYSLSEVQMRALNDKLSYLVDAAGRLGRTDWRGVLIGTMLSFVLSVALPPDPARHIFFSILRGIGHRYGFPELEGG